MHHQFNSVRCADPQGTSLRQQSPPELNITGLLTLAAGSGVAMSTTHLPTPQYLMAVYISK